MTNATPSSFKIHINKFVNIIKLNRKPLLIQNMMSNRNAKLYLSFSSFSVNYFGIACVAQLLKVKQP